MRRIKSWVYESISRMVVLLLQDKRITDKLWQLTNIAPVGLPWPQHPYNITAKAFEMASETSARYVMEKMPYVRPFREQFKLFDHSMSEAKNADGLIMEFGVGSGTTTNYIAGLAGGNIIHGFDSFVGLPEDWAYAPKGFFSRQGQPPSVKSNVKLHIGPFDQTIKEFVASNTTPVRFMHIDSDLYSSAKTVLTLMAPFIVSGTVIQFDEYFNYPGWQQHEIKAFQEFLSEHKMSYEYIGYVYSGFSVAVRIV